MKTYKMKLFKQLTKLFIIFYLNQVSEESEAITAKYPMNNDDTSEKIIFDQRVEAMVQKNSFRTVTIRW